ncbi:MAG: 50S ribosomal protein L1 [Thaumarchaeota archaeon]|nr:MAG: 50S ribosomal protein L1 [Nitrososphaerota archaeon]TLX91855.1 MAG: 50S ribosomal protein L1 [Nitrososphaerota archaeon]
MLDDNRLKSMIKNARDGITKRNFTQSAELTLILKDIDVKKGFSINEVVNLPNKITKNSTVCVFASGDMGMRAKKARVDRVVEPEELDRLGTNKKDARKIVKGYDFFLSDTSLMSSVGRSLGQFMGPKGKMPSPLPYGAPIENITERFRGSVRARVKSQLNISAKIGDEKMQDDQLVNNALAVISAIEKKLPQGDKNIHNAIIKFTMSKPSKASVVGEKQ